jgi:pimeloyl-ACP methyl ester carboxylesterase
VLFIAGKQDVRIPVQDLLQQVALPAHSELLLLEHSAHMGWIEQQEITLPALKHFAKRIYNLK